MESENNIDKETIESPKSKYIRLCADAEDECDAEWTRVDAIHEEQTQRADTRLEEQLAIYRAEYLEACPNALDSENENESESSLSDYDDGDALYESEDNSSDSGSGDDDHDGDDELESEVDEDEEERCDA